MGRQVNFYMEEKPYRQIVEKALQMGFVILHQECVGGKPGKWEYEYHWYETMPDFPLCERHYFYSPAVEGFRNTLDNREHFTWEEIKERKLSLGNMFAAMIEAGCSCVSHESREIAAGARLYIRSDYYDAQGALIKQDVAFLKQYASLVRAVKKLAPKQRVEITMQNLQAGKWFSDIYITDYLVGLSQNGYVVY